MIYYRDLYPQAWDRLCLSFPSTSVSFVTQDGSSSGGGQYIRRNVTTMFWESFAFQMKPIRFLDKIILDDRRVCELELKFMLTSPRPSPPPRPQQEENPEGWVVLYDWVIVIEDSEQAKTELEETDSRRRRKILQYLHCFLLILQ